MPDTSSTLIRPLWLMRLTVIAGLLAFWEAAAKAKEAGVPLPAYLELRGWSPEKIALITGSVEYQQRVAMMGAFAQVNEGG